MTEPRPHEAREVKAPMEWWVPLIIAVATTWCWAPVIAVFNLLSTHCPGDSAISVWFWSLKASILLAAVTAATPFAVAARRQRQAEQNINDCTDPFRVLRPYRTVVGIILALGALLASLAQGATWCF